ncbi:MAG: hypothetical protein L6Q94_19390 [Calditrichia bacterium]|nr:hypothetical protein [Calditrichia bacterium]
MIRFFTYLLFVSINAYACLEYETIVDTFENGSPKVIYGYCGDLKLYEEYFHENGQIKIQKDYWWQSLPFGIWYKFDEGGSKVDSGNFVIGDAENRFIDELIDGQYLSNYENGKIKLKINFKNKFIEGQWVSYYENGNIQLEGEVESGRRLENWKSYTKDGNLYSASVTVGPFKHIWFYTEHGNIREEHIHKFDLRYAIRTFHENNRIASEFIHDGPIENYSKISFYDNGIIRHTEHYKDGARTGLSISYYANGNIRVKGNYEKYHRIGRWYWYYENSKLKRILDYGELGYKTGDFVEYYENGQLRRKATFERSELVSDYYEYNEDSTIMLHLSKEEGRKNYEFKFHESGPDGIEFKMVHK